MYNKTQNFVSFNEWFNKNKNVVVTESASAVEALNPAEALRKQQERAEVLEEAGALAHVFGDRIRKTAEITEAARNEATFREEFTKKILSNVLVDLIDESLLLDRQSYAVLNPNYRTEIKTRVNKLLESDSINFNVTNDKTKTILEAINKEMPLNYNEYSLLEDNDLTSISNKIMSNADVNQALKDLNVDVREKVADIVIKDTTSISDTDNFNKELDNTVDAINATHDSTPTSAEPAQPEYNVTPMPVQNGPAPMVEEVYSTGIIETITLNEAKIMLDTNGSYNSDLALANALKFVTVLEAFNATDLMDITSATYSKIVNKTNIRPANEAIAFMMESNNKIVENVKPINTSKASNIQSYAQWLLEKQNNHEIVIPVLNEDLTGKYTNDNGKVYTEGQLKEWLEVNGGYNFRYDNFEDAVKIHGFKKN